MRTAAALIVAASTASVCSTAMADLTFSFADPVPGRQLTHAAPSVTFDTSAALTFLIDGSTEPISFTTSFQASLQLNLTLGFATAPVGGFSQAPVAGDFVIRNLANANPLTNIILSGSALGGAFVRIAGTNSILFSHETGFGYTAGPELLALLVPGRVIVDPQEAVFTVTDVLIPQGGPLIPFAGGQIANFTSNASFSGNASVVPTPGAAALGLLGGMLAVKRKRK